MEVRECRKSIAIMYRLKNVVFMDIKMEIGRRIKIARGSRTLRDVASKTKNLTISRISNYEQGIRMPGPDEAKQLAKALGNVTAAYLLCVDDESALPRKEKRLLDQYRRADERGQAMISSVAESAVSYHPEPVVEKKG